MPRRSPTGALPDWPGLYRLIYEQQGYFTTAQAQEYGVAHPLLRYYLESGHFQRALRGIYRLSTYPPTPAEDLVTFWLWSDREGVFSHATALVQHHLSDVLPGTSCMTVPMSWQTRRLHVPDGLHLHYATLPAQAHVWIDGVPVTRPLRSVIDCISNGMSPEITADALHQAVTRRLFSRKEYLAALRTAGIDRLTLSWELQ